MQSYSLKEHIDTAAVQTLTEDLLSLRGQDLDVDAGETTFIGALGLQVLIAVFRQWGVDGFAFRITVFSDAFSQAASGLGIDPSEIGMTAASGEVAA